MKIKSSMFSIIAILALSFAQLGSGITCWGALYQPPFPEKLRK